MTAIWVPQQSCCPCSENTTLIDKIPEPQEEIRGEKIPILDLVNPESTEAVEVKAVVTDIKREKLKIKKRF